MTGNRTKESTVLVLQGGGALGAYQAGVYEELASAEMLPNWIAGISIGAINGAIIAGNSPDKRVEKLRRFWDLVSSRLLGQPIGTDDATRKLFNEASAALVASTGVPGFFDPRMPPAVLMPPGTREAISVYDTSPLRDTLLELIDFDLLNSGRVRYSLGTVHLLTGNMRYFDTLNDRIGVEHIMASGALPPGFPPVDIDGEPYWDGGLVSNTPLQYVSDGGSPKNDMCIFQVDLFSARGPMPKTLLDVAQREKEIRYSSRTRMNTEVLKELQRLKQAIRELDGVIDAKTRASDHWQSLTAGLCEAATTIVHLIHRRAAYWTQSNDYEFSRYTVDEHWSAGRKDVRQTLDNPKWKNRDRRTDRVTVFDLTNENAPAKEDATTS